jgi:hypothetical protein
LQAKTLDLSRIESAVAEQWKGAEFLISLAIEKGSLEGVEPSGMCGAMCLLVVGLHTGRIDLINSHQY